MMKFEVGKKYIYKHTSEHHWYNVVYSGDDLVVAMNQYDNEVILSQVTRQGYEEYKETKKVWMAPALYRYSEGGSFYKSNVLYDSAAGAVLSCGENLIKWPSHPDDLKLYEVPVE